MSQAKVNKNENWMKDLLEKSKYKWKRQAQWGYRLFDFWCAEIGVAIEVDGEEHNKEYDSIRDIKNMLTSGIVVFRVRNRNENGARKIITRVNKIEGDWNTRRLSLGLKPITTLKVSSG